MKISKNCSDLIKEFEGFSSKPYICPSGLPTIGYGSTFYKDGKRVTLEDKSITEEVANELLEYNINKYFDINSQVENTNINQNQFDALTSFAYNVGMTLFNKSTLLKKVQNNDFKGASDEFPRWTKSKGKVLKGLVRRREAEKGLFNSCIII